MFERVDLILQFSFNRVCHLEFEAGLQNGRVYGKLGTLYPAIGLGTPQHNFRIF
jgi:hypothetical protein